MQPGKPEPILLGPRAIHERSDRVVIITPLNITTVYCPGPADASRVAQSLRRYVEIVDVSCSNDDITRMIKNAGIIE